MNRDNLMNSMNEIDDLYLKEAANRRGRLPVLIAAALAVVLLALPLLFRPAQAPEALSAPIPDSFRELALPAYPEMAAYPNGDIDEAGFDAWKASRKQQYDQPDGYADGTEAFFYKSLQTFLTSPEPNTLCSPLNIYMMLAMTAETAGGSSRQQILDLLGCPDLDALRTQAGHIWNANYSADGATATVLASSLWASDSLPCSQEVMDSLSKYAYASAYQGDFHSPDYQKALEAWICRETHGLLDTAPVQPDPDGVMALVSTLYYRAKWSSEFDTRLSTPGIFHAVAGDTSCTFMNRTENPYSYYWGDNFGACSLYTETGNRLWLILPDPGHTPQELIAQGDALRLALGAPWRDSRQMKVNLSVPKFDLSARTDLRAGLESLGVTEIFDPEKADFSPAFPGAEGVFAGAAEHSIRMAIDEEGISAAAYTMLTYCGAAPGLEDEIDFVLDRPFLFVLTSAEHLPLLAGTVGTPE